jgi:hypothetical protein
LRRRDEAREMFDRGIARAETIWPDQPESVLAKREVAEALGL